MKDTMSKPEREIPQRNAPYPTSYLGYRDSLTHRDLQVATTVDLSTILILRESDALVCSIDAQSTFAVQPTIVSVADVKTFVFPVQIDRDPKKTYWTVLDAATQRLTLERLSRQSSLHIALLGDTVAQTLRFELGTQSLMIGMAISSLLKATANWTRREFLDGVRRIADRTGNPVGVWDLCGQVHVVNVGVSID